MDKNIDSLVSLLGLDMLELDRDSYKELLHDIVSMLYGSPTSRPKAEVIAKRANRYRSRVFPLIAAKLTDMLSKFNENQLEFAVSNIGDMILGLVSKLYHEAKRLGRDDLIGVLRVKWANAWLAKKYSILPPECPKCGFNAVLPDLTCLVCGSIVDEKGLKNHTDFKRNFIEAIEIMNCNELSRMLRYDYVYINGSGIKPSIYPREPVDVDVYLSDSERKLIKEYFLRKCRGVKAEVIGNP